MRAFCCRNSTANHMTKEGTDSNEFHEKEDTRMQLLECGRYKKTTFARDIIGGKYHDDKFAEIFYP